MEPSEKSTNIWPTLRAVLDRNAEALAEIRGALDCETLQFDLDYHQGFRLLVSHLAQLKSISQWLSAATVMKLRDRDPAAAFENLQACIALPRVYSHEPMIISQLVRMATGAIGLEATWEALQFPDWTDGQLAQLQSAWAGYRPREAMENVFAMERAMGRMAFVSARTTYYEFAAQTSYPGPSTNSFVAELKERGEEFVTDPKEALRSLYQRFPFYWLWKGWWSYEEELCSMQLWQASIEAARLASGSNSFAPALGHFEMQKRRLKQSHPRADVQFAFGPLEGYTFDSFLNKVAAAETQREMVVTAIALKRYHLRHGKYPTALSELVPLYLRQLPLDWMDGNSLRYRPKEDGTFLLYSVGENRKDDGGDPSVKGRAFYFWRGQDAVWPVPATAEEIADDNAGMEKNRRQLAPSLDVSDKHRQRYGFSDATNSPTTNSPK